MRWRRLASSRRLRNRTRRSLTTATIDRICHASPACLAAVASPRSRTRSASSSSDWAYPSVRSASTADGGLAPGGPGGVERIASIASSSPSPSNIRSGRELVGDLEHGGPEEHDEEGRQDEEHQRDQDLDRR